MIMSVTKKEVVNVVSVVVGIVVFCALSYGMYWVFKTVSYGIFYESMVIETLHSVVKAECLVK